jgi:hypothetical protein
VPRNIPYWYMAIKVDGLARGQGWRPRWPAKNAAIRSR